MKRTRCLRLLLVLLALPLGGCHSSGDECDTCTADDQCKSGLFCSSFSDGSKRCASGIGATNCRVRYHGQPATISTNDIAGR